MYQSTSYVSRGSKTVMVTMAERSAQAARLLHEARAAQPERVPERKRSLVGWAASRAGHLLRGQRDSAQQRPAAARS
jgi:hypothetical protein